MTELERRQMAIRNRLSKGASGGSGISGPTGWYNQRFA